MSPKALRFSAWICLSGLRTPRPPLLNGRKIVSRLTSSILSDQKKLKIDEFIFFKAFLKGSITVPRYQILDRAIVLITIDLPLKEREQDFHASKVLFNLLICIVQLKFCVWK